VVARLSRIAQGPWHRRSGGHVARYAAPVAFLIAVTAVVLVVRSALRSDPTPSRSGTTALTARKHAAPPRTRSPALPKRSYVIQSGDTLERIAARFSTTIDALLRLNPGVEPTALIPGEHVRVK
jgi:LysM repeat protein